MSDYGQMKINGRCVEVPGPRISVLDVLLQHQVWVPTLCHHPVLGGQGRCGLCVVEAGCDEVLRPGYACQMVASNGLAVNTDTALIRHLRARAARLLLDRGPFRKEETEKLLLSVVRADTAHGLGARWDPEKLDRAKEPESKRIEGCILCGLCVLVCRKTGRNLLTFLGRGEGLRVGLVARSGTGTTCGSCRACQRICPTGHIDPDAEHTFAKLY